MQEELNEQEIQRRKKLEDIIQSGVNPYPAETFDVNCDSATILKEFTPENESFKNVSIAGRIMSVRDMGKAAFVNLQDSTGRIQLYIKRDDICPGEDKSTYDNLFKKHLDIGDFI